MSVGGLDLERTLVQRGALLEGHFRLSSGRHSDRFVQKFRVLEDPALLEPLARAIAQPFRARQPRAVVGAAVGGILLAYEVARQLHAKAMFVEKERGVPLLRRGFSLAPRDRVLIVEDVLTTGVSVRETVEVVRGTGAEIVGVGIIVARDSRVVLSLSEGHALGTVHVLLDLPLQSYEEVDCPQCRAGMALQDPGSRRA